MTLFHTMAFIDEVKMGTKLNEIQIAIIHTILVKCSDGGNGLLPGQQAMHRPAGSA